MNPTTTINWNSPDLNTTTGEVIVNTELDIQFEFEILISHLAESFEISKLTMGGKGHPKLTHTVYPTLEEAQDAIGKTVYDSVDLTISQEEALINSERDTPIQAQALLDLLKKVDFPFAVTMQATGMGKKVNIVAWIKASDEECNQSSELGQANLYGCLMDIANQLDFNLNNYAFMNGDQEAYDRAQEYTKNNMMIQSMLSGLPPQDLTPIAEYAPTEEVIADYHKSLETSKKEWEEDQLKDSADPLASGGVVTSDQ